MGLADLKSGFNPTPELTEPESFILYQALDSFEREIQLRGMNHQKHWFVDRTMKQPSEVDYLKLIVELRGKIAPGYNSGLRYESLNPGYPNPEKLPNEDSL